MSELGKMFMTDAQAQLLDAFVDEGWEWAIVEIMGFRKHAGRCREIERFGAKMLRIDIPLNGDPVANGWETHFYGGSAMFSYTPTDQDSVMRANKPYAPPSTYRLPAPEDEDDGDFREVDENGRN